MKVFIGEYDKCTCCQKRIRGFFFPSVKYRESKYYGGKFVYEYREGKGCRECYCSCPSCELATLRNDVAYCDNCENATCSNCCHDMFDALCEECGDERAYEEDHG